MVIGIDLATRKGTTCICKLNQTPSVWECDDVELIVKYINDHAPEIVTLDAPLSFPEQNLRAEEKKLQELGISVLPPGMPGMRYLTKRGIKLKEELNKFKVREVYPHATKKIMGINIEKNDINDAYIAALTGILYLKNFTVELGESLIIPSPKIF